MNLERKLSCYSSSICRMLEEKNIIIEEEKLYYSDRMMLIDCRGQYDAVHSDIESIVCDAMSRMKLSLREVDVKNVHELDELLEKEKVVLTKTKTFFLNYSNFFSNVKSDQNNHYLVLTKRNRKMIVIDSYIPSTPFSSYEGEFDFTDNMINMSSFYVINICNMIIPENNNEILVKSMADLYFMKVVNLQIFERFRNNVKEKTLERKSFYEMATAISTSGLLSTRRVLVEILRSINCVDYELINEAELLYKKYNLIRLLLLKCSVKRDIYVIDEIDSLITNIKFMEERLLRKVSSIIYEN